MTGRAGGERWVEEAVAAVSAERPPCTPESLAVNPTLLLKDFSSAGGEGCRALVWKDRGGMVRSGRAEAGDLLALKMVLEGLTPEGVAAAGGLPVAAVDRMLDAAIAREILLAPASALRRPEGFASSTGEHLQTETFTLQWHITSRCDLNCLHCYDRSPRSELSFVEGLEVLRDLRRFCRARHVAGQVSFTGGNPFLHDDFERLYRSALDLGLRTAILGNPVAREPLQRVLGMGRPEYFQVSLEGLREHNDRVRGRGNFDAVLAFLDLLGEFGIFSVVMLTLTAGNLGQVLPLGEILRGRASLFSFSRLARFGAGRYLDPPAHADYLRFARDYLREARGNPVLGRKDGLLSLAHLQRGEEPFGGCTGFGCGAAFSFLSLLPDGEVHACRKFPSRLGSVREASLEALYDSPQAERYRAGSSGCNGCRLRAVCGGCAAVTAGEGLDPFTDRDPFCPSPIS
ncbi:MAG TPA: thio(seleno)oxazole modification radical SAM maturase SbtM [Verrucomicrobiae bacterium]|nr:thio(seleno)oxazole modification radical SAM maturase SbtM [Verrucomicrobiae bacterium]